MKILHILRSEADPNVEKFIDVVSEGNESTVAPLYQGDVNWLRLVDDIFSHDKVICWW
ncbi:hypothetical protein QUF75_01710 [Desulfococcaceae bacterium HSG7]|nr:hypothetical protein [Desulfococcaceae bacterium HSG9]MDM8553429.1 hypothetical protein [Desulfococcaceae bacterium HSG7]